MKPRRVLGATAIAAVLSLPQGASACGACVEDKVAATYDHAVVQRALGRRHVVVFADVKGAAAIEDPASAARRIALGTKGIDRGSVRAARSPAALSFALDPSVSTPAEALRAVERAGRGLFKLEVLRVIA